MAKAKSTYSPDSLCEVVMRNLFRRWRGNDSDLVIARAPGRINIIGEHTDYNQGLVMPMILDRSVYVACRPASGACHIVRSEDYDEVVTFEMGAIPKSPPGHWSLYVGGMLSHVPPGTAVEMLIAGNVPLGAGLSSSAALEMATGLAAEAIGKKRVAPVDMAKIGQKVEHEYLGVKCGLMDQMVSRMGRPMHAFKLDCRSFEWEHIPLPESQLCFVIVNSQVRRALAASKYNERRMECEQALAWFNSRGVEAASLRDISLDMIEDAGQDLTAELSARARHVVTENERVIAAAEALNNGNWSVLGQLLTESHRSLQNDYQVSCNELDTLVDLALGMEGVYGARMMGGGFGGCTLNLMDESVTNQFESLIKDGYQRICGRECRIMTVQPGLEATVLD